MGMKNTTERYGSVLISMHWLMVLLLIAVYLTINLHDAAPKGSEFRADMKIWHFMLGLGVFALVLARVAARLFSGVAPEITPRVPAWQHLLAKAMHLALYLFMLGMPILGWIAVSAKGSPIIFFGLHLPPLIGQDKDFYASLKEIHKVIGTAGYYLVGLHAAAALLHHYFIHDNTLRRILPARR